MKTSSTGLKLIERYEGLILSAYDDYNDHVVQPGQECVGTITIGYGHTSSAGGVKVYAGQTITKAQAEAILADDLSRVENDVNRLAKVPLNQNQFDALVSFHFNTGALGKSSALKYLNEGNYEEAANRLALYTRANGQVLQGLVSRRAAEKALFLGQTKVVPPKPTKGVGTGTAVIVGGGAVAYQYPEYLPYILIGTAVMAFVAFIGYRYYKSTIEPKVVASNDPVPQRPVEQIPTVGSVETTEPKN